MTTSQATKERVIENLLNKYNTYKIGRKNCEQQMDYIMPTLTTRYDSDGRVAAFYIANNTEQVALDRITSKRALDLLEEIERYNVIISCIDNALTELDEKQKQFVELRYFERLKMYEVKALMNISEEKTLYRVRRQVLDKFLISLGSLVNLK